MTSPATLSAWICMMLMMCNTASCARSLKQFDIKLPQLPKVDTSKVNQLISNAKAGLENVGDNVNTAIGKLMPKLPESYDFKWKGDGTAYSEPVNNTGEGFACSYRYLNDKFSTFFAAVNSAQWDEGRSCGKCAVVKCIHPMCTKTEPLLVQVVDLCPECKEGDLDFNIQAFKELTGIWPHRLTIEWDWADCGDNIDGPIQFDPKDGITQFWQAFYLSNSRFPIVNATLNGMALQRSQFNFWVHPAMMPTGPITLELTADNGKTLTTSLSDMTKKGNLGSNFE